MSSSIWGATSRPLSYCTSWGEVLLLDPSISWADTAGPLVVSATLIGESLPLSQGACDLLTERTRRNLSIAEIARSAREIPKVAVLRDIHVWATFPTPVCMTAHVRIDEMGVRDRTEVIARLRDRMSEELGILHSVFELKSRSGTTGGLSLPREGPAATHGR